MSLGDEGDASLVEEHFRGLDTIKYGSSFKIHGSRFKRNNSRIKTL